MAYKLDFKPSGEQARAFLKSQKFFRGIRGPVGSGKSVACCMEVFRRGAAQKPGADGIRRTRWAIIRNTNPQLKTTTIKTWLDWFPEEHFGPFSWSPPFTHWLRLGDIEIEVIFLALDKAEDVRKLLSLELTGVFVNEAREVPKAVIDACTMRVGRYPSMRDGGPTWYGVIADTNAPEEDHWWPIMAGEAPVPEWMSEEEALMLVKPEDWEFFTQPSAMLEDMEDGKVAGYSPNPKAENAKNLTENYYPMIIQGKRKSWIDVYVMNRLGNLVDGRSVHSGFSPDVHVSRTPLAPVPGIPIGIGIDFGLTPAAIMAQRLKDGRWLVLRELVTDNMGAQRFAAALKRDLSQWLGSNAEWEFSVWGDPAGDMRAQTDETTPFQILRANGVNAFPAPGNNDFTVRVEAVDALFGRMVDGKPGLLLDPRCRILGRGWEGGYHFARQKSSGFDENYRPAPAKNRYSHPCEAFQYLVLGYGEGRNLLVGKTIGSDKPTQAKRSWSPFDRSGGFRGGRPKSRRLADFFS